jgi:hypothetical protein
MDNSGATSSEHGDSLFDNRLVGLHPSLEILDAGLTPGIRTSPFTGSVRPKVLLRRLILRADAKDRASVAAFSFCVDQALASAFRPGDLLYIARTGCAGLGLSVIRAGQLVAAVGAITAVPLGAFVNVRIPSDVIREAELVFSKLDSAFEFRHLPIEVRVGSERRVLYAGRPRIGDYEVFVEHGFYRGVPGTDACAGLSLVNSCPDTAVTCSAQLLEYSDLSEVIQW